MAATTEVIVETNLPNFYSSLRKSIDFNWFHESILSQIEDDGTQIQDG